MLQLQRSAAALI